MSQFRLNITPLGAAMGLFFIAVAMAIIFLPYTSIRTFAQQVPQTGGEAATSTPPTTSTTTAEVDTSTPVLSLVRTPDTTTGEVNLRLEWTTSRSSLTPAHVLKREPSQEPWSVEYSTHSLSAGDTSYDIGTESELWRLWRTGDNLEFAVRFAGSVYSNSVTLSRPSAGETATTTPPTTSTTTAEVDTSTPVLSLVRAPDTTTGEVNLRLEWTTSRSSLTPAHVLKREPSQEPWSVEYSTHSLSAGDTSYDIGTESELWRLWRTGDNLEFAVRFAGSVYSNSVTLSRPSAGETATTTPPTTSTPTVEVDTSTPVLTVERTLNAAGNKFVIRLAWETSRDDLIFNQHIYIRELGESNWGGYISFGNEAATSLTQDESHYWSSRLERGDTDPFEVAVGFRVVGDTSRAVIYSNPVTLYAPVVPSRPTSCDNDTSGRPPGVVH